MQENTHEKHKKLRRITSSIELASKRISWRRYMTDIMISRKVSTVMHCLESMVKLTTEQQHSDMTLQSWNS